IPAFTLLNLNILGKMGFGALGGFEYIAILAGETKSPTRTMRRSVLIAAPIIAIMFVLGTATVVAYVPTNDIDLVGPLPQVLRAGFGPFGIAGPLVTIAILMTLVMRVAQASVSFTAVTRLPMVAGWDRMLPAWFSKLHRKYQTPVNSILVVGACSFVLAVLSNVGVGQAEAFQLLFNASGMFYALTYVVMFSIPLFGLRGVTPRPPLWLKVASTSGLLMTVLYIALSVFPIIKVESVATFAFKILSVIVVMNVVGIGILMTAKRRVARAAMVVAVAIASGVALTGAVAGALTATASTASAQDRSQSRSMVTSQSGIVASESVLASQVGARILEQGGNAIDAAIATNAMMGLVAPMNDGIGGDLFAIVYEAKTGKLYGLNASGWAPAKLTADFLLKQGVTTMPMKGIHTVTVPGAVDGWDKLLKKFGTKTFVELLAPAIHFAEQGFPVAEVVSVFWKDSEGALQSDAPTARTFLINGHTPAVGEVFRNPDLAWTYKQLATNGRQAFYTGEVAKKIIATSISHGGTMTPADLAEFQGEWVEPISTTYKGWTVHELPPNGQGIAALEMLNIMETFPLAAAGQNSVRALHFMIEAKKLAYADMQRYDADPRFAKVPVAGLNSKDFARERAKLIDATRANCAVPAGKPMGADNGTTYLSVVDRAGNMVSLIQSNYSTVGFGSGLAVGGAGFVLHNRGGGFTLDKTSPNVLAGRKRPFHTIIPAFMDKGDVRIAFGIMGGFNQAQAHAQFVSNIADFGLNIQGALDAPRFSKETFEGCDVGMESRIPDSTRKALIAMGHQPVMRGDFSATRMGAGQAVMRNFATGVNFGASDPRKDGAAVSELVLQSKPGRASGQPASRRMVRQP
ncbi:MAG: gamma-glutamyltransferase, partial [Gemmatimonas sp.]